MITAIILALVLYILPKIHSYRLRKFFNFRRELRKIRKQRKPKIKQPVDISKNTLIGHAGRRPVYIPDTAKHVFICGTTGSGKTVAISNFINHITQENLPALIVDGKGDVGEGSILEIVTKMATEKNKKLYVINLSDTTQSDQYNPFRNASPTVANSSHNIRRFCSCSIITHRRIYITDIQKLPSTCNIRRKKLFTPPI